MAPGTTAQTGKPDLAALTFDQLSELLLHRSAHLAAIAHQRGFSSADGMIAYEKGRPRYENGSIVLCDTPGLSLEEALNERAKLHGMPPIGTKTTSEDGIEWEVVNYGFFPLPAGLARYPNDSDYLPLVCPTGISERLAKFLSETDHCTSKHILFIDTMPSAHPFKLGEDLHYAISSSNPDESYILLDVAKANETTFAHEIAHLWLNYVQDGGDGMRRLREEAWDNVKHMQLSFVQSFVVDLKVNDLIAERGFDMSSIRHDEIHGLTLLRDAFAIGYRPPTSREALLHSISIADAILDQKRWPDEDKQQLAHLLEFFEAATPQIYQMAQDLVEIVGRHGYDSQEAIRKTLDECISLAFRATGDDFDVERDLEEFRPGESMKDKYPDELPGCPVPLKFEIAKTMARNGISGPCQVGISASDSGMAQITTVDVSGVRRGPLAVNYQLMPPRLPFNFNDLPHHRPLVGGKIPDTYGRLPGDAGYNTANPPGADPFSRTQPALVNGRPVDQFGRLPGESGYNTCFPPGHGPFDQINAVAGFGATQGEHMSGQPWHSTSVQHPALPLHGATRPHPHPFAPSLPDANRHNPMLPGTDLMRPYMAGVGLAVARARLAQQIAINANLYQYALNNPLMYIDPSGLCEDPGGGSGTVRFCFASFIPQATVPAPGIGGSFLGDNRSYSPASSSFRTEQQGLINICGSSPKVRIFAPKTGVSTWVGHGSEHASPDGLNGSYRITPSEIIIHLTGDVGNPFYHGMAPPITYDVTLKFDLKGNFKSIHGTHTRFPAFELYIYPGAKGDFGYDPRTVPIGPDPGLFETTQF